jgi:peptidoglycan-associated lipoprotein
VKKAWTVTLFVGGLVIACSDPKYPNCESDEHCNTEGHKGVCVQSKCVECRSDATCGKGRVCKAGACAAVEGYCDDKAPCGAGKNCKNNRCEEAIATPVSECDDAHPCSQAGARCQNGHCYVPPKGGPGCEEFPSPKFAFESAELTAEAKQTLERLAKCMTTGTLKGRNALLTGHCDARGEYEFNMGLGAQRAEVIKVLLTGMGVTESRLSTTSRGKLDANGTDEPGYANDRRVDIEVR